MKKIRLTLSLDPDVYEFAVYEAARKKMTLAQELRWLMRDGYVVRQRMERESRALAVEEKKYGG